MKKRHLAATTALACVALALTACSSAKTPVAAGDSKGSATAPSAGSSASPGGGPTTSTPSSTATPAAESCGGSEKESDVTGVLTNLDKTAAPRWSGVIKLTNVSKRPCKLYGPADVRTDGAGTFTKLVTGVLGDVQFVTDPAKATVLQPGESLYQAVSWLSSPPTAPNASCTTGNQLALYRNEGAITISVPVKDARFCPAKDIGSPQVMIGAQLTVEAQATAQLQAFSTKK
ncbi:MULTISPECIES: DUF4232 domain-containing protein [unclassified Kitasatospora]|uniref:DUF4232 domain-containing protein n=1 Tax=unclassified Kitasatospora TaxID=2633591 RepID=UPI00070B21EF|nr:MULTISPECIES: DUF4232 domain-containing protein [unclassified Kitasatospora]KQV20103.1 hypothetical protein ASC99_22215 [Kitasatospora sp. Root107]KRB71169.1 hypothetical protein ASE03_24355 [Kitasatospora sp. Root187]